MHFLSKHFKKGVGSLFRLDGINEQTQLNFFPLEWCADSTQAMIKESVMVMTV
jgi:hypothetical protein